MTIYSDISRNPCINDRKQLNTEDATNLEKSLLPELMLQHIVAG